MPHEVDVQVSLSLPALMVRPALEGEIEPVLLLLGPEHSLEPRVLLRVWPQDDVARVTQIQSVDFIAVLVQRGHAEGT